MRLKYCLYFIVYEIFLRIPKDWSQISHILEKTDVILVPNIHEVINDNPNHIYIVTYKNQEGTLKQLSITRCKAPVHCLRKWFSFGSYCLENEH